MIERNEGTAFNADWIENININYPAVVRAANEFKGCVPMQRIRYEKKS